MEIMKNKSKLATVPVTVFSNNSSLNKKKFIKTKKQYTFFDNKKPYNYYKKVFQLKM